MHLVLPALPPEDIGAYGTRFYTTEFQKGRGLETCLCIFEEPEWALRYGSVKLLDLRVTCMAIRASGGPVAIAMWHLLESGNSLCSYEHYLDPLSDRTLESLRKLEEQSRLKVVMRDNQTGSTTGFWEFDNHFQMGDFASSLSELSAGQLTVPFDDRVNEIKKTYTAEQLHSLIK